MVAIECEIWSREIQDHDIESSAKIMNSLENELFDHMTATCRYDKCSNERAYELGDISYHARLNQILNTVDYSELN